jgi:hypothetical protein
MLGWAVRGTEAADFSVALGGKAQPSNSFISWKSLKRCLTFPERKYSCVEWSGDQSQRGTFKFKSLFHDFSLLWYGIATTGNGSLAPVAWTFLFPEDPWSWLVSAP